jgi:hypothetical protein
MSEFNTAQYIRFQTDCGDYVPERAFQAYFINKQRTFEGVVYRWCPFRISGGGSSLGGSGMQASFVTVPNPLTVALVAEACLSEWLIEVKTVLINVLGPDSMTEAMTVSTELWSCTGGKREEAPADSEEEDTSNCTIQLTTPLDAVGLDVPRRVLSAHMVGSLPPTGSIFAT